MVNFPTRDDNILDVFCANCPSLVDKCVPITCLSYHNLVLVDSNVLSVQQKPVKRKTFLRKRADKQAMSVDLEQFTEDFVNENIAETPVDTLWSTLKQKCTESVKKYVPYKYTSTKSDWTR